MRWPLHRWLVLGLLVFAALSVGTWWTTRERLPDEVRLATASRGGMYYKLASALAPLLEERAGVRVRLIETEGSAANVRLLRRGGAELGIVQASVIEPSSRLAVLAPLHPDVVHVVTRRGSGIRSFSDLEGRNVSVGPEGSGMRSASVRLLEHYAIPLESLHTSDRYFMELETDPDLAAAIVTTGIDNPDLNRMLSCGRYSLLPIPDAAAIGLRNPAFFEFVLPSGYFGESPRLPPLDLRTVATSSVLVARDDVSQLLVNEALAALYATDLRLEFPHLIDRRDALERASVPLHPTARSFLDPYGDLVELTSMIEALAGLKELLVGLGALGYVLWDQARRVARRDRERVVARKKERLDHYLQRTVAIERAQVATDDVESLRDLLLQVTRVKLAAIEELTDADVRGDRLFLVFMTQCAHLSRALQERIHDIARSSPGADATPAASGA